MKKEKYSCHKCGIKLYKESIIKNVAGDKGFCKWCAEKENLKAQANQNCTKCKGNGYTIFYDEKSYPIRHTDEIMCKCQCTIEVKQM